MAKKKGAKQAVTLTDEQKAARDEAKALARAEAQRVKMEHDQAVRLAQIVNLYIAGMSLAEIGLAIGATEREVDQMLTRDATRYIRNQPALRTYVRNFVSSKYTELLEPVMPMAKDPNNPRMLEAQDRALRTLDRMAKLHGAEAPVQKEVTIEAAPEAVERLVAALADESGLAYNVDIFDEDVMDAEIVGEAVEQSHAALEAASDAVEQVSRNPEEDVL